MKIQRNDLCPCGSGRKFKKCCVGKSKEYIEIMYLFHKQLGKIDHKQEELLTFINRCDELLSKGHFTNAERNELYLNLMQVYNWAGFDKKVLEFAKQISLEDRDILTQISILCTILRSYENIGDLFSAYNIVQKLQRLESQLEWGEKNANALKSGAMIEIGKYYQITSTFAKNDEIKIDENIFLSYYDQLIAAYEEEKYHDIDHYLGALGNKAAYLLNSEDEEIQQKGLELLNKSYKNKVRVGYWNGIANDFSRLGIYYLRHKKYKQAMAYTQRDLQITKRYGSIREVISSLVNLTTVYMKTFQLSEARKCVRLIQEYAEKISYTEMATSELQQEINHLAIECKNKGIIIGKKTPCPCGSGKTYEECCGIADMDYTAIEKVLGLDFMIPYGEFEVAGGEENKSFLEENDLRTLLRKLDSSQIRLSWARLIHQEGVDYVYELPDMSSVHLNSAKRQLKNYKEGDLLDEISSSLSIVMLSIASLEAFLNQLSYFLGNMKAGNIFEKKGFVIPEDMNDCVNYQRNKGFSDKLNEVANIYTFGNWNRESYKRYDELFKFIKIRNELVHFKSVEFFRIIPFEDNDILKSVPKNVKLRDVTNSWPFKLLTESFAAWGIDIVENTINYIKDRSNYEK